MAPFDIPHITLDDGVPTVEFIEAPGVAVISQSCDIVRGVEDKPSVQVAILRHATADELERIKSGAKPSLGYVASAAAIGYAVDFEVTATVAKEVVSGWNHTVGCTNDMERRNFAAALARHRQRFAFPDDFNDSVRPVRRWLEGKRSAQSAFGRLVREIKEVRVTCDNWDAPTSVTYLLFVDERGSEEDEIEWEKALLTLADRAKHPKYPDPEIKIVTYDDVSAKEYRTSDRLDLDGLSDA